MYGDSTRATRSLLQTILAIHTRMRKIGIARCTDHIFAIKLNYLDFRL